MPTWLPTDEELREAQQRGDFICQCDEPELRQQQCDHCGKLVHREAP